MFNHLVLIGISLLFALGAAPADHLHTSFFTVEMESVRRPVLGREGIENKRRYIKLDPYKLQAEFSKLQRRFPKRLIKDSIPVSDVEAISVYTIENPKAERSVLITGGVHGDEAMGVVTAFDFVQSELENPNADFDHLNFIVVPIVNINAIQLAYRYTFEEGDYNRQFMPGFGVPARSRALMGWLEEKDFGLALDLHQGMSRSHFFIIKNEDDESGLAERAMLHLPEDHRLDLDEYEPYTKYPSPYLQHGLGVVSSNNPHTFKAFLKEQGAISFTMEAPGIHDHDFVREMYLHLVQKTIEEWD